MRPTTRRYADHLNQLPNAEQREQPKAAKAHRSIGLDVHLQFLAMRNPNATMSRLNSP